MWEPGLLGTALHIPLPSPGLYFWGLIPSQATPLPHGSLAPALEMARQADTIPPIMCTGETEVQILEGTHLGSPPASQEWGQKRTTILRPRTGMCPEQVTHRWSLEGCGARSQAGTLMGRLECSGALAALVCERTCVYVCVCL